jgi:hypothetical protein
VLGVQSRCEAVVVAPAGSHVVIELRILAAGVGDAQCGGDGLAALE